ncbi:MAG TPA: hypothetical protein VK939_15495 [Longimicrobiales bacterium]|nr:hypothetical protein [Longimicrobiales bacterium]
MIRRARWLALALLLLPPAVAAQTVPFGKNKIQYRDFDWQVLSSEHLDVYYYPEEESVAKLALAYGEESFRFLEAKFQHHPFRRIPLIVYASDQHFEQTNLLPGFIPEGVLGFTEYLKRRVALPFRGDYEQFRSTLRHELVHAFQLSKLAEVAQLNPRGRGVSPQRIHWWTEGLAEFWSSEQTVEDEMFVRDLVVNGNLPSITQFTRTYSFFSYPLGAELHKYLSARFGEEYIPRLYETYWQYDSFDAALAGVLDVDLDQLNREWRYALEQRFFPAYAQRPPLAVGATPVITRGGVNYKPTVYVPAGDTTTHLLFLSPRNGYMNLYRTRLERGERDLQTVLEGERSAEFESFHAHESGFDVHGNGVVALGSRFLDRDALLLWDLERSDVVGRYQWPDLVGIRSPAWNVDGTAIAFEGLSTSGFSDLYVMDFRTGRLERLTEDRYRDADPDWSPDGRAIVFASDRTEFGADGATNLFLIDVATREVSYLTFGPWRDQTPAFSHDGRRIAFSSDRAGAYDIYAIDPQGSGARLTNLTGGAFDPVWLPGDSTLVFAGFEKISFRIFRYALPPEPAIERLALELADRRWHAPQLAAVAPDTLPPEAHGWSWQDLDTEQSESLTSAPYRAFEKLSIDFAAADALVAPGFGSAQGIQFLASDMLGDHILFTSVSASQVNEISNLVDSFSGSVLYLNLENRLNYGAGLFRFKGRFRDVLFDVYDEEAYGALFLASYPFSKFRRVELQLGLQKSERDDLEDAFEEGIFGGGSPGRNRDLSRSGVVASNFVSFVQDNTLWLPTGPIDGQRFNISAGLLSCFKCSVPSELTGADVERAAAAEYYVLLADYRRYFRTSLYSAYAVRAYGYYSDGAIPGRAALGGPHRLRGYPHFSLAGSRVWLLNQEWRFPVLHGLALAFPFGTLRLPGVQGALFADAGSSWLNGERMDGVWGSYGTAFRTSLGGAFVLRLDVGKRFAIDSEPPVAWRNERFRDTFVDFFFGFNY